MSTPSSIPLPKLDRVRERITRLDAFRVQAEADAQTNARELEQIESFLGVADQVSEALETLSDQLFQETLRTIEKELTIALQEILEQPIRLVAEASWKHHAAAVDFFVERNGNREDILKGQGGSVANILSIGLRLFALASLDSKYHRPFLVFDEQDCWLRPDLVPKLVRIVSQASRGLGFQVLMISHHHRDIFEQYADKIYQLTPGPLGVAQVECVFERDPGSKPDA